MTIRTLDDLDVSGKRVLIRADLNVPLADGGVTDSSRVDACAPTILAVLARNGKPIVMSHLGRPKGRPDSAFSLRPVGHALSQALGDVPVRFAEDCVGDEAEAGVKNAAAGEVVLLENLRFHEGESRNEPEFAAALAELGEVYVNDAFSAAHRAHASIVGVAERLPSAAGRLMQRELESLSHHLAEPRLPYLALLGGAKVGTKLGVVDALLEKGADVALGGAMANTVLLAKGCAIGESLCDREALPTAKSLLTKAKSTGRKVVLPTDVVVAPSPDADDQALTISLDDMPEDSMILDAGPRTIDSIVSLLDQARTVVWNGPFGAAEKTAFAKATLSLGEAVAQRTKRGDLVSVVGGGDTVAVLGRAKLLDRFTYASMAGGAFLTWLKGEDLPGVAVLRPVETSISEAR